MKTDFELIGEIANEVHYVALSVQEETKDSFYIRLLCEVITYPLLNFMLNEDVKQLRLARSRLLILQHITTDENGNQTIQWSSEDMISHITDLIDRQHQLEGAVG